MKKPLFGKKPAAKNAPVKSMEELRSRASELLGKEPGMQEDTKPEKAKKMPGQVAKMKGKVVC